ncbi:UbiA family prenyltransferase [Phreatobacter stygius]|nr:UbiA family prenyltransferase [Phreatobacter stygius]
MYHHATSIVPEQDEKSRSGGAGRPVATPRESASSPIRPLVLDLDGTLLRTDVLLECIVAVLRRNPLALFSILLWALQGRAVLKQRVARLANLDLTTLPVDQRVVALARAAAAAGRPVVLATAATEELARGIAERFPFISHVIASNAKTNLKGPAKAEALIKAFPEGFDYAGDSAADLPVFAAAETVILVRARHNVVARAKVLDKPTEILAKEHSAAAVWARALRLKQWSKNALVFAPIPLAGALFAPQAWIAASLAFLGLGLVASATYLVNDLFDLPHDRQHWSKRDRPLASGALGIKPALLALPALMALGFGMAALAGPGVVLVTALYVVVTLAYSLWLKQVPIVDVSMLAGLFTLRLLLGVVAIGAVISPWLFVFSFALFLSLSSAKRHTELTRAKIHGVSLRGRGYQALDEPLLLGMGLAAVASSVLILILYLMAEGFRAGHYTAPGFLWCAPVIIFLWQMRIWLLSQRGVLDDDPVTFAIRDRPSLMLGAALVAAFLAAHLGGALPWPA